MRYGSTLLENLAYKSVSDQSQRPLQKNKGCYNTDISQQETDIQFRNAKHGASIGAKASPK